MTEMVPAPQGAQSSGGNVLGRGDPMTMVVGAGVLYLDWEGKG